MKNNMNKMYMKSVPILVGVAVVLTIIFIFNFPIDHDGIAGIEETPIEVQEYFNEKLRDGVIEEIGQPIHGFVPFMFLQTFLGLVPQDFNGVEALLGEYTIVEKKLIFILDDSGSIHSAAEAVSEEGMKTLFLNIANRAGVTRDKGALFTTTDEIDGLLLFLGGKTESKNSSVITILNQGGNMEGHTPRGFSGSGTGLFAGDNLNPGFPNGDGVQTFLTFDISKISESKITSAFLKSDNAHVNGTPFEDLGNLFVDGILYDNFSRNLWNSDTLGRVCTLAGSKEDTYECDVTSAVNEALTAGASNVQFRVRFDKAGDSDGRQDIIFFYITEPNTNEPGIFELEITTGNTEVDNTKADTSLDIIIPIVAYLIKDSEEASTQRDEQNLKALLQNSQEIWNQADITLDISIREIVLNEDMINSVTTGDFRELYSIIPPENREFSIFYVNNLLGPNGIAFPPGIALVADITSVDDFRATAHEIGHLLGLVHTLDSRSRLMFPGANGRNLSIDEIAKARDTASFLNFY